MNIESLQIILPALAIGLMISIVHASLGLKVLSRGIIFIDIAIAQIAGLGLVIAQVFLPDSNPLIAQLIALTFAILASLFFCYIEKKLPKEQEAIIGSSFILAASIVTLLFAGHAHGSEEISHLLSGQILFNSWSNFFHHLPIYILIMSLWFGFSKMQNGMGFYLLFALAITSSVQLVGVYVVFASLILPALAAINSKKPLITAWLCGILAIFSGIFLSFIFDLPTGSIIVISYVILAVIFRLIRKFLKII